MYDLRRAVQTALDEIDRSIKRGDDAALTLEALARALGYSKYHATRRFRELTGMALRDYLRLRRLAFAFIAVRDSERSLLDVAVAYGFSSHEAFTRAFKAAYGVTPRDFRKNPVPVVLQNRFYPFDFITGKEGIGMADTAREISVYFETLPAHKLLHIKNYQSQGYWDFWERQDKIAGQDCDTICGLLDSVKGKLDGEDGVIGQFSGQLMAHLSEADGRTPEAYGVRLPADFSGAISAQMLLLDVPGGEYIVFEHGPFDFETESEAVGIKLGAAIDAFDYAACDYAPDSAPGRAAYFQHVPARHEKRMFPVKRK